MLRSSMNKSMAAHKAPERQEETAVQGRISTRGTVVWQNRVTLQTPGQLAEASSTFWRTIPPHSGAVHSEAIHSRAAKRTADFTTETVSTKRSRQFETIGHQQAQQAQQASIFKAQIDDAVSKLHRKQGMAHNDLSFCLMIVDTYRMLDQELDRIKDHLMLKDYKTCRQDMIFKLHQLYDKGIKKALEFFQSQITIGNDWIYTKDLDKITRCFTKLGLSSINTAANKALLTETWNRHLDNELNYLRYLEGSPDGHGVAQQVVANIKWLTDKTSPVWHLELISATHIHAIMDQAEKLYHKISNSVNCSDAGNKIENVRHKANDTEMEKRKCHDLLLKQLKTLQNSRNTQTFGDPEFNSNHNRVCYLQQLLELYKKYNKLVDNPHTPLFVELNKLITRLVIEVQSKLKKGVYDGDQTLKEKVSLLISDSEPERWLHEKYENPCFSRMQSQNTVIPAVPENIIMYTQVRDFIDSIFEILADKNHGDNTIVLKQFRQLIDKHGDKLKKLTKHQLNIMQTRIKTITNVLFSKLYSPILNDFNNNLRGDFQNNRQTGAIMCRYKDKFIELTPYIPYIFSPDNPRALSAWQNAACFAWFNDLWNLSCQTSFTENDVDNLLDLKVAAPDLPAYAVGDLLVTILTNLFPFMLKTNPNTALIEKVTKLSEWIYYIGRKSRHNHGISQVLYEYNEEWREKYIGKAGERATTSSSTSAARMPSSVHPGALSVPPGAFDCHSRMSLQDTPHTGQFSTPRPTVPTPTHCGASWQPESSIPCRTPDAQSAAGSRPFPPPWLIDLPFPPRIPPAPAHNRVDSHQPVCGQIQPWWQAASQQQYKQTPTRSAMPFEYKPGYPFSSNTW